MRKQSSINAPFKDNSGRVGGLLCHLEQSTEGYLPDVRSRKILPIIRQTGYIRLRRASPCFAQYDTVVSIFSLYIFRKYLFARRR